MCIHIARHAETTANQIGIILGHRDSPPTAAGLTATGKLADALVCGETGIIVASPLGRAVATAEVFARVSGWRICIMDDLRELSCGQWEGCPRHSVIPEGRPLRSSWTDAAPDGESCRAAEVRVAEAIRRIKEFSHNQTVIVGHAGINQIFLKIWLALEPQEALSIRHPHDLLYTIDAKGISWLNAAGEKGTGLMVQR